MNFFTKYYSRFNPLHNSYSIVHYKHYYNWEIVFLKYMNEYNNNNNLIKKINKGAGCSRSGNNYEKKVWNFCKNCKWIGAERWFNTQSISQLAGSGAGNDIECNYLESNDVPIEIKRPTPDWMQCSIEYSTCGKWQGKQNSKIPEKCRDVFNNILYNNVLYNGDVPPFMTSKITHDEWCKIKSESNKWDDFYIEIPSDTIRKLYHLKGCKYIQIDGYGLYKLDDDVCNFDVPLFDIAQRMRIRTKIHSKKNSKGFCTLSVTAACQPVRLKDLVKSKYSLDDKDKIPAQLEYVLSNDNNF